MPENDATKEAIEEIKRVWKSRQPVTVATHSGNAAGDGSLQPLGYAVRIDGITGEIDAATQAALDKMAGLLRKKELIRTGNAGVTPDGRIVDIREYPEATRLPPHNDPSCAMKSFKLLKTFVRSSLRRWRGLWRLWWGKCPACNGDAIPYESCPVCLGYHSFYAPITEFDKWTWRRRWERLAAESPNDRIQRPPVENLSKAEPASPGGSLQ